MKQFIKAISILIFAYFIFITMPVVAKTNDILKLENKSTNVEKFTSPYQRTSSFVVEFKYNNKEFILEGNSKIKLTNILNHLGIEGKVDDVKLSDYELLDVSLENREWYLTSLLPFNTDEWMNVSIEGKTYHIKVTDDFIGGSGGETGSSAALPTEKVYTGVPSVFQGDNENNFTKNMPIGTIFIDESVINMSADSRNASIATLLVDTTEHPGFIFYNATGYLGNTNNFLSFNNKLESLNVGVGNNDTYFEGDIIKYTFTNGAALINSLSGERTDYDIEITYSNLYIALQDNLTATDYAKMVSDEVCFGLFEGNMIGLGQKKRNGNVIDPNGVGRYGIRVDVNIRVIDKKTKQPVAGTFYFPMVDIDVNRTKSNNTFGKIANASDYKNYSEQILITNGLADKIYIPGGDVDFTQGLDQYNNMPYLDGIEETSEGILIYPSSEYASVPKDPEATKRDVDFYTGFVTLVQNDKTTSNPKGGISFKYFAGSPETTTGIETYLLAGASNINHLLVSSTTAGGNIQTTRNGNHDGTLTDTTDPNLIYGPTSLTSATGQTIVYTMTPEKGYILKKVTINRNSRIWNGDTKEEITPTAVKDPNTGEILYYTFAFEDIKEDNAIHVEWLKDKGKLKLKKETINNETGDFNFKITLTDQKEVTTIEKAVGDNYVLHADDIADFKIDIYNKNFTFRNHNANEYRAKEPGSGAATAVGIASGVGSFSTVRNINGSVYVWYPNAATDSDGNYYDVWIKYDNTTIHPDGTVNANNITLFHGRMDGFPTLGVLKGTKEIRNPEYHYGVTTTATIYIAEHQNSAPGNASTAPTFTTITNGTVVLSADGLGESYTYGNSLPNATNHGNFTTAAEIAGVSSTGSSLSVTTTLNNNKIDLTGFNGSIIPLLKPHTNDLSIISGSGGKAAISTTGSWNSDGTVPDDAKLLEVEGKTYYVPNGKTVTVRLVPEKGYEIDTLKVNGVTVTPTAMNGYYTYDLTNMSENQNVSVTWKAGTPPGGGLPYGTVLVTEYYHLNDGSTTETSYVNQITLSNGESKEWEILHGWNYTIEEVLPTGWHQVSATNATGTILGGETTSSIFTNELNKHDLTVTKKVTGNLAKKTKEFSYNVKVKNTNGDVVTGDFTISKNGAADTTVTSTASGFTINLKHQDKIVIKSLPYGYSYEIVETQDDYEAYREIVKTADNTTITAKSKTNIAASTITDNQTVNYINNKEEISITGKIIKKFPHVILLIIALVITSIFANKKAVKRIKEK